MKQLPPKRDHRAQSSGGTRPAHRVVYGINPVSEALRAGRAIEEATVLASSRGPDLKRLIDELKAKKIRLFEADRHHLAQLADSRNHQGVVAKVEALPNGSLTGLVGDRPDAALTVLLVDHLQDPQNLGAVYRSAESFGVHLIFLPAHESVSHQLGSVAKASAGAVEHVPTVVVRDLAKPVSELKKHGFRLIGLSSPDSRGGEVSGRPLDEVLAGERLAIVLGAEGAGLSKTLRALCDEHATIPTTGKLGSLNAGTACGIALYERWKITRG
jgi:23S rRNA (guanosine2251-2'-O)-methyltransferase